MSKVSSMREVQAILYEYREEDIQIPYLLAECVDYLMAERDRLREMIGTALQLIPRGYDYLPPVKKSRVIRDVKAVLIALQETKDDI